MKLPGAIFLPVLLLLGLAAAQAAPPMALERRQDAVRFGAVVRAQEEVLSVITSGGNGDDAAEENVPGAPGKLRWRNGEALPGELTGASEDSVTLKTPMFDEPLVLDWAALRRYDRFLKPVAPADPFSFALRDGGHLYGELVAITADTVTLRSVRHGKASLRRAEVTSIRRVERNDLPAGGATGEAGWRLLSDQPGNGGKDRPEYATGPVPRVPPLTTGPGGALAMPYWNTGAFRPMELPGRLEAEFCVRTAKRPDFAFALEPAVGVPLRVETWDGELVLVSGDQFQSLGMVGEQERAVSLRLLWDQAANRCQVFDATGAPVADWTWQPPDAGREANRRHVRSGVMLRNKGRSLDLERLRIRAWDGGLPTRVDGEQPSLVLADGRAIQGEIAGGSADTIQVRLGSADALASVPLAGVDAIVFSTDGPVSPADDTTMTLTWADGTFLRGRMVGLSDGRAAVQIAAAPLPLSARMEGLRRLQLPAPVHGPTDPEPEPLAQLDKLVAGDLTLHGELSGGDDGQPRWLPIGGRKPAAPAHGLPYEIRRAKPAVKEGLPAPAFFYTSAGDILPGTLRSLDETEVNFDSDYVEAKKFQPVDLDAVQFNTNTPRRIDGFSSPAWRIVKGDASKLERKDGSITMEPGSAFGHPSVMQCSELRFDLVTTDAAAMRLRMFSSEEDGSRGVNLALFRSGSMLYYGMETTEGQVENQQGASVPNSGAVQIRLVVTDQQVELFASGKRVDAFQVLPSRRAGNGLILEPASLWGSRPHAVELSGFSAEFIPGRVGLPTVNAEAKRQALSVPRFRKDNPPRQALLALNGDVLRGELLAATADHFAFRSGLETLRVPRDRVRAAVWLKAPSAAGAAAANPPAPAWMTKRCQLMGQYAGMRLRDYVGMILQGDQEIKVKYPPGVGNRRAQIRFDQPTAGDALNQICAAFDLDYRLEGDTLVIAAAGTPPTGMQQSVHWLKLDTFSGPTPAQELLAAKGVDFPAGAFARWDVVSRQLTMTNTAENQRRLTEVLDEDFGGSLGTPTHWLSLTDGTRLGLAVDRFERDWIVAHHPVYGRCRIPLPLVALIRTTSPQPDPAAKLFADWQLVPAPEPVLPGAGSQGAALVGTEPKSFRLPLLDGGDFELAEERGKVVVLDFWATWCAPCIQSLPGLIEAMSQFPADRVRFVGLNQAESSGPVRRFRDARGWKLEVALDAAQNVGQQFGAETIPYTVVIGPDGKVVRVWASGEPGTESEIADTVRKLLDAPSAAPATAEPAKKSG